MQYPVLARTVETTVVSMPGRIKNNWMDREMKRLSGVCAIVSICSMAILITLVGCGPANEPAEIPATGFLSDYANLKPISPTSYRYMNPKYNLRDYSRFIIDPVEIRFTPQTKDMVGNWDELEQLRAYMHKTLMRQLINRYDPTATRPGPGVARLRIALTNVAKSAPFRLGSVSMEAELVDTQTTGQIGAVIESQSKGVPLQGYDHWSGAKAAMDDWAMRFYNRLEEARGY
jgi:hypothetical protein